MNTIAFYLNKFFKCGLAPVILVLGISCSDTGGVQLAEGGISGTGISTGSITGFSSVILNGRKLEITTQTQIFVDQQAATESELKVGYVIRVDADFDENTADRIDYLETVRGPLEAIPVFNPDTFSGNFNLLGQSVVTNSGTVLDGLSELSTLNIGDVLEVSGVRDSNGAIIARYISLKSPLVSVYRVLGTVANATATTFTIGALTIDYAGADISELGIGGIENGAEVHVKGASTGYNSVTTSLIADKITQSPMEIELVSGNGLELEGAITDFLSASDFEVNGIAIDASNAVIENGSSTELQLDLLVEVEGRIDANVLIASKVKIIPLSNIRVESTVESVDTNSQSIVIHGQVFFLDDKTQLEDDSSAKIAEFSLDDLSPGDWVEIRGFSLNNKLILTRLERDDPETDVRIQAPVDANGVDTANNTISILGITVSTNLGTDYEDIDNQSIPEIQFFDTVQAGNLVKARWKNFTNITLPVDELSIED